MNDVRIDPNVVVFLLSVAIGAVGLLFTVSAHLFIRMYSKLTDLSSDIATEQARVELRLKALERATV